MVQLKVTSLPRFRLTHGFAWWHWSAVRGTWSGEMGVKPNTV
ncbi:hypothetical protein GGR21_003226 [Dysgonomonas hofstadii]|uniref:Uncharacterized protein n=1 Tax=Dysgonomonas hofstadii TaxID=637886 RepID=A0A840CRM1_9BACT|nr:hypothetical protein [Dysgonomonas hofstadii]